MGEREVRPDTVLELGSEPAGRLVVTGERCTVRIGRNVVLQADVLVHGTGCTVEIGDDCQINGVLRIVRGEGGAIRIGAGTTIVHAALSLHEAGEIRIGRDCMLASEVFIDPSDMHPIYDRATGARVNPAADIEVGDHVWIGKRVTLAKGARIGDGAVIGANSLVVGEAPANVVAAGSPARVVRENVEWRRDFNEVVEVTPEGLRFRAPD